MEPLHELLKQLLETAIESGWTVLRSVLTNLSTELVLRRLTRRQASSKDKQAGLELEDQSTHEHPLSSDQQPAWWVPIMQEQAAKFGSHPQYMLDEVNIVLVAAKESPAIWSIQDLEGSDVAKDFESGLLEVSFRDIATNVCFDGYIIEAKPVAPNHKGIAGYKSPSVIARPRIIGDTVTETLSLHPGTKYHVTVFAVVDKTVQISPNQRNNDDNSVTTLLSAPFLNTHDTDPNELTCELSHVDKDSDAEGNSRGFPDSHDGTHFKFSAIDDHGNTVAAKLVDTSDDYLEITRDFFQSIFANRQRALTLSVSQGYMDDHRYKAMSDTVLVTLKPPVNSQWREQFLR